VTNAYQSGPLDSSGTEEDPAPDVRYADFNALLDNFLRAAADAPSEPRSDALKTPLVRAYVGPDVPSPEYFEEQAKARVAAADNDPVVLAHRAGLLAEEQAEVLAYKSRLLAEEQAEIASRASGAPLADGVDLDLPPAMDISSPLVELPDPDRDEAGHVVIRIRKDRETETASESNSLQSPQPPAEHSVGGTCSGSPPLSRRESTEFVLLRDRAGR
jgi:hypothetical protein